MEVVENLKLIFVKENSLSRSHRLVLIILCFSIFFLHFSLPSYLEKNEIYSVWPVIGIVVSLIISGALLWEIISHGHIAGVTNTRLLLCLLVIAYTIHQYEENGSDLYDRKQYFPTFANKLLTSYLPFFSCHNVENCAFTHYNVMAYNTIGLWIPLFLAPIIFPTNPMFVLFVSNFAVVNTMGHIAAVILSFSYSPGSVSAIFLVLPLAGSISTRVLTFLYRSDGFLGAGILTYACFTHGVFGSLALLFDFYPELPVLVFPLSCFLLFFVIPFAFAKVAEIKRARYLQNFKPKELKVDEDVEEGKER
jgi:multidrug transporter EmrE-like cation transporter